MRIIRRLTCISVTITVTYDDHQKKSSLTESISRKKASGQYYVQVIDVDDKLIIDGDEYSKKKGL